MFREGRRRGGAGTGGSAQPELPMVGEGVSLAPSGSGAGAPPGAGGAALDPSLIAGVVGSAGSGGGSKKEGAAGESARARRAALSRFSPLCVFLAPSGGTA